jgi:hypothetical protein
VRKRPWLILLEVTNCGVSSSWLKMEQRASWIRNMCADHLVMKFSWLFWMMGWRGGGGERNSLWRNLGYRFSICPKWLRKWWYASGWPSSERRIESGTSLIRSRGWRSVTRLHKSLWKVLHEIVQADISFVSVTQLTEPKERWVPCYYTQSLSSLFIISENYKWHSFTL